VLGACEGLQMKLGEIVVQEAVVTVRARRSM
jgi:hypothetical protein